MPIHGPIRIPDDRDEAKTLEAAAMTGELVRLHPRVYVEADVADVEKAVLDAYATILAALAPGAVLSGTTARRGGPVHARDANGRPTYPGWIYATHDETLDPNPVDVRLPGLEIHSDPGPGRLEGDHDHMGCAFPSQARQALENVQDPWGLDRPPSTIGRAGVEEFLAGILDREGREAMIALRDRARRIATPIQTLHDLPTLEEIVAGLLREREIEFAAPTLAGRSRPVDPYDRTILDRLEILTAELTTASRRVVADPHVSPEPRRCVAFAEAYFTNFIEGTRFKVAEARRIVEDGEIPAGRHAAAHDVLRTHEQVVAFRWGHGAPDTFAAFLDDMRERHASLMAARPDVRPGMLKVVRNRAGNHVFVAPDLVVGTLREGFEASRSIEDAYDRGLYLHFLATAVHPFDDGNGRISRILMNRELVAGGRSRIVVPTISRTDYVGALRSLSRSDEPTAGPLVRVMGILRDTTAAIALDDMDETILRWGSTNAFLEDERDARLEWPNDKAVFFQDGVPAPSAYWDATFKMPSWPGEKHDPWTILAPPATQMF